MSHSKIDLGWLIFFSRDVTRIIPSPHHAAIFFVFAADYTDFHRLSIWKIREICGFFEKLFLAKPGW